MLPDPGAWNSGAEASRAELGLGLGDQDPRSGILVADAAGADPTRADLSRAPEVRIGWTVKKNLDGWTDF